MKCKKARLRPHNLLTDWASFVRELEKLLCKHSLWIQPQISVSFIKTVKNDNCLIGEALHQAQHQNLIIFSLVWGCLGDCDNLVGVQIIWFRGSYTIWGKVKITSESSGYLGNRLRRDGYFNNGFPNVHSLTFAWLRKYIRTVPCKIYDLWRSVKKILILTKRYEHKI